MHRVPLVGPLLRQPLLPVLDRALAALRRDEAPQPIEELGLVRNTIKRVNEKRSITTQLEVNYNAIRGELQRN